MSREEYAQLHYYLGLLRYELTMSLVNPNSEYVEKIQGFLEAIAEVEKIGMFKFE